MRDLDREVEEKIRKLKEQGGSGLDDGIKINDVKVEELQGVEYIIVMLSSLIAAVFLCPIYTLGCCR